MNKLLASIALSTMIISSVGVLPAGAEESKNINIRLQIDNEEMQMNDSKIKVEKPFLDNGSTLVPLRVITTAFGATIKWNDQTQSVELAYGNQVIVLKIGSTEGTLNGKKIDIPVAPQLKNGTTMVPLRFISETFGAKVEFDASTQSITITGGVKLADTKDGGSNIDEDAGKTFIGDSYLQWSMKYPTGLIKSNQSFRDSSITFKDAKNEYALYIGISDLDSKLSNDALIKEITDDVSGTIISKTYVSNAKYPYASVVTKDSKSAYTVYRAIQQNNRLYIITLYVQKEENYKSDEKMSFYNDLIDSFAPEFTGSKSDVKDISTVKDGWRTYTDAQFRY
ncbi:copper amine oxidase N-terminal domain-containing protein [Paenibacillus cremeus]|uniref:Copper amine oxidase N-terminal domain-containing protein n=1 Tax=Paenibacillus cremeus TaxID=2163881 RepID=A0A559K0K6_9BACL|nr:copper amine oxidase N-terminal domain-containing protein [Paenibacillus cremeus]TVY05663.1 copper amine oxidase N-terminal domain-containing protein [Paenibacillus cremeus]